MTDTNMSVNRIALADFLLIAEAVLGINAERLALVVKTGAAESALEAPFAGFGDFERYPAFADKAAVLCARLVRNHPLPDGNKRSALIAMIEFVERNGREWLASGDVDDVASTIERLAARDIDEDQFRAWVTERIGDRT